MFLQKVKDLACNWNVPKEQIVPIAREAMLYGMKLKSSPNTLKRLLKKLNIYGMDTKIATRTFKGNAYLLHKLPTVLVDRNAKIPNLNDFFFAKNILNQEQRAMLSKRVEKLKTVDIHALVDANVQELIKRYSSKGEFFSIHDSMYEKDGMDFRQSVATEAVIILNTEFDKLTSYDSDTVGKYMNTCLGKKSKSLITNGVTKSFKKVREVSEEVVPAVKVITKGKEKVQPQFVKKVEKTKTVSVYQRFEDNDVAENISYKSEASEDLYEKDVESFELKHDLERILPLDLFNGVALYCGFSSLELSQEFDDYLSSKGLLLENLSESKKRKHIESFLKVPVFAKLKHHPQVRHYFQKNVA